MPLQSNRDLYLFVAELGARPVARTRSLEHFLSRLWQLGTELRALESLSLDTFAALLEGALDGVPPSYDQVLAARHPSDGRAFMQWEHMILEQIVDLHEMQQSGTLDDEQRYFGIDSPRGARWYNFTPSSYLECGVAGTFDGWQDGDATGRGYVPGNVAVLDATGHITAVDPRELAQPPVELSTISWDVFVGFLGAGQYYE